MHTEVFVEATLSQYEIERDKPLPSKHHAIIQGKILFLLRLQFGEKLRILPEISLDLSARDRVPDLAIYRPMD